MITRTGALPAGFLHAVVGIGLGSVLAVGCRHQAPTAPSTPTHASISLEVITATGETLSTGGYLYHVAIRFRESAGVSATIQSVHLSFVSGSSTLTSSDIDHPISDSNNQCPANGTVVSRDLTARDTDLSHPYGARVQVSVTFSDAMSITASASGSADVAPLPPAPTTFTLAGVLSDAGTGQAIQTGQVQILDGSNAGKASSTDGNGYYSMAGVVAGSFTAHATAAAYDPGDRGITVSRDTRLDIALSRTPGAGPPPPPPSPQPCAYTLSPTGTLGVTTHGGDFMLAITRTAGTCGWQATSNVTWITFPSGASGGGSASFGFSIPIDVGFDRTGVITVTWSGGSAQLTVSQTGEQPELCSYTLTVNGQSQITVPGAGGVYTATAKQLNTFPPCGWQASTSGPEITLLGPTSGPGSASFDFRVSPNPSTTSARGLFVYITFPNFGVATLTVSQNPGP